MTSISHLTCGEIRCVKELPRLWTEVPALYGPDLNPVWSGGLAFSYFPAVGGYGLTTLSADGKTITINDDFTRLAAALNNITTSNTPTQANSPATSPATCPTEDGTNFFGSSTLPPTPNQAVCDCFSQKSFGCLFTPQTSNTSILVGQLLDYVCSTLGSVGSNCNNIGGDGGTGVYGTLSSCDPCKLHYQSLLFVSLV